MISIVVHVVFGVVVLVHGAILIYDPPKLLELYNKLNSALVGRHLWFRHDPESLRSGFDRISAQISGILATLFGLYVIIVALLSIPGVLPRTPREAPPPTPEPITHTHNPLAAVFPLAFVVLGFVLVISPERGSRILGAGRYYEAAVPNWTWRAMGLGFIAGGGVVLRSLLR